jgi:rhodanese-related sulfurtransferase
MLLLPSSSSRRQLIAGLATILCSGPDTSCQAFTMIHVGSLHHNIFTTARTTMPVTTALNMAAPGVELSSTVDIQAALTNPETVVVDARRVDEIADKGYWKTDRQWVNAPCTPDGECPLLDAAAPALLRNPKSPVIVYCASGKRAAVAQQFLLKRGYTTVLNAGAYPDDFTELLCKE